MAAGLAADAVVVLHGLFVLFVIFGWVLVARWPRVAWVHLPAAIWGALIEFAGWICPLTPLEVHLRELAGSEGYESGFIEHYFLRLLYPEGLTRSIQLTLGGIVVLMNVVAYAAIVRASRMRRS